MENILREFTALNKIPRPSGHEEAVAAYLAQRGRDMGYQVETDANLNVIYQVPPSQGYETAPLTILQAHMDMVCVGGPDYNPETDPIVTIREDNTLRAVGTSLGADDGIGVALILDFLASGSPHGPLRILFTADEEEGMSGAAALAASYLDASYLLNLDWEDIDSLCIGCAGFLTKEYSKKVEPTAVSGQMLSLSIDGLRGGHSGTEIGDNRANAIKLMAQFLEKLVANNIEFNLISLEGGRAVNVIPYSCRASIAVAANLADAVTQLFKATEAEARDEFNREEALSFTLNSQEGQSQGYAWADSKAIALFLSQFPQGVKEYSPLIEDAVSLSANLAQISVGEKVTALVSYRSDLDAKMLAFADQIAALGQEYGFNEVDLGMSPAWTPKANSGLEQLAIEEYAKLKSGQPKIESVHAGLECSYFARKNPDLEMISLGPTVLWCHSVAEVLYLDTLPVARDWLRGIVARLK